MRLDSNILIMEVYLIRSMRSKNNNSLPFFGLSLGYTMVYLSIIMLLPLAALFGKLSNIEFSQIVQIALDPRVLHALNMSITSSLWAALINLVFCFILCWILVRYEFFGKKFIDAIIDIPFALPTAIAGVTLASLYSKNGWLGKILNDFGIEVTYHQVGIVIALIFVGIPFVVRTIEPVLIEFSRETEEAAINLGATRAQIFFYIILPSLMPAMITGFVLAFARGLGEYGSVIFIAGNIPKKSEILPLLINVKLEQYDYDGATILALIMLSISFAIIFVINVMNRSADKMR